MPKRPVGTRALTPAERSRRYWQRKNELIEELNDLVDDLVSALKECRAFVNPEEGPPARLAIRKADSVLRRAGEPTVTEDDDSDIPA
jgi:hypothetical protein